MKNTMKPLYSALLLTTSLMITGCGGSNSNGDNGESTSAIPGSSLDTTSSSPSQKIFTVSLGSDINRKANALLSLNPDGPGGSSNQSLRGGDVIVGEYGQDNILIGGLGVDILVGDSGDDILIGGTEDFNSNVDGDGVGADNRDRAFGNAGNDTFIWAPGDGSDFFDGGEGTDVLIFGVLGEQRDSDGSTTDAPFFNVNPPKKGDNKEPDGSQDFDGIFLDENNSPIVNVSTSPGFCSVFDRSLNTNEMDLLDLDHIVRFSLKGFANDFDEGNREDDDGLRVAISAKNVEYVVCTPRESIQGNESANIEVLDLTTQPPTVALLSDLPDHVAQIIR